MSFFVLRDEMTSFRQSHVPKRGTLVPGRVEMQIAGVGGWVCVCVWAGGGGGVVVARKKKLTCWLLVSLIYYSFFIYNIIY